MKISNFVEAGEKITGQYNKFYERADKRRTENLYREVREIYFGAGEKGAGFGKAVKHYFEKVELYVNPADIFADIANEYLCPVRLRDEEYQTYVKPSKSAVAQAEGAFFAGADFGHTMPDWGIVFGKGIPGILGETRKYLKNPGLSSGQRDFYLSVKYTYEGILIYIKRLKEECERVGSENSLFAAKNLCALLEGKPKTLAEAMQLYFVFYSAQYLTQGNSLRSLGAVDDILLPYYEHDAKSGVCTEEDVRELLRYFLYKLNSRQILANMPFNLCTHTSRMTYLILEEYIALNIPDPKIHVKCSENTPDRVYEIIMKSIRSGNNSFVFVNDEIVKKALVKIGIEKEDAEDYTLIGCYEASAAGKELPCTLNGRINMPMAVETVLNGGKKFGSDKQIGIDFGKEFDGFEAFYASVKAQLKEWTESAIAGINEIEEQYPNIIKAPVLSAAYESCMKTGTDVYSGGAKYNNSSICIFGTATLADELTAIKKAVYEDKIVTPAELKNALENNWSGREELRRRMAAYPKYGNNTGEADDIATDLVKFMSGCINGKPNGRGGVYRMGMFSIDWIIEYGKKLGASADGRFAGEPVSKNLSSSVGADKKGVTGVINSATKFDFTESPDGAVLDLHLHPTAVAGEEGIGIMTSLLKTYLKKGGFAAHINVTDPETLKAAQKNPEKYKNLQVRLCGWNVYFTDLDGEMQNNLIKSMEEKQ